MKLPTAVSSCCRRRGVEGDEDDTKGTRLDYCSAICMSCMYMHIYVVCHVVCHVEGMHTMYQGTHMVHVHMWYMINEASNVSRCI